MFFYFWKILEEDQVVELHFYILSILLVYLVLFEVYGESVL